MIRKKQISLEELGIATSVALEDIPALPSSLLPTLTKSSELRLPDKVFRAKLYLQHIVHKGSFGDIRLGSRCDLSGNQISVFVKSPRLDRMDLKSEAILQHSAHACLIANRIPWAIPQVYDIFRYGKKTMFSMELIPGLYLDDWFAKSATPDKDFLLLMTQLSIFLCILHQCIGLDHRDLKADNLLITASPCRLRFQYKGDIFILDCPFRLHLLDFGFACLGEPGETYAFLNLGDGILPKVDPCPKEGRDLFQFLLSLLCLRAIRLALSHTTLASIESWTGKKFKEFVVKSLDDISWIYLLTSKADFHCATSTPYSILRDIVTLAPELFSRLP